jgi:hypothetical protein
MSYYNLDAVKRIMDSTDLLREREIGSLAMLTRDFKWPAGSSVAA